MFIEDLICRLAGEGKYMFSTSVPVSPRDTQMITSFARQVECGNGFTEKQAAVALRFCNKYKSQLNRAFQCDLTQDIDNPKYAYPLRIIKDQINKISIAPGNPKKIQVSFHYDENLIRLIRELKAERAGNTAEWDPEKKSWMFNFTEGNIHFIKQHFAPLDFDIDPEIQQYIEEVEKIVEDFEQYVPIVRYADGKLLFDNTHPDIPQPTTSDILDTIFEARRYGIRTWDDSIEIYLNHAVSGVTKCFLSSTPGKMLAIDSSVHDINQFNDIVRHAKTVLVIIPANNELKMIQNWHRFLISEGFLAEEMSVLFRLENSGNKEFNEYIKSNQLNMPLSSKTKIFFVSQKLPKPLIRARTEFDVVINLGSEYAAHYSLQNLLSGNPDVIIYNQKGKHGIVL